MERLTRGEAEVMRILWEQGEMKPAEVQERFPREIKNSALRSYLAILLKKGHVTRRLQGKAYYYRARTRRDSAFRRMLREMADVFFAGSTQALICRLIKNEGLSEKELLDLKRLSEESKD
jgi:predicted transcriptional regulator